MRMRLMLLGGGNALGQALIRHASEEDVDFLAPVPPETGWDVPSLSRILDETQVDVVVNLAYYHDWFQASDVGPERLAEQEHVVKWLALLCQQRDIILIHPSSYRVFDGTRSMAYTEDDPITPLGSIGHLFANLEQAVHALCPKHVILRFGWMLDGSADGWMGRFLKQLDQPQEAPFLADDRRGCPTPVADAARVILAVLKQLDCAAPLWGCYHYAGHDAVSQLILGQTLMAEATPYRLSLGHELVNHAHVECPDAAVEPQQAVLGCKKISSTFGIKPRPWRAGLTELLDDYYRHV